jgi:superfamily II DNA or RNA helicase
MGMIPYKAQLDAVKAALRYHRGTLSCPTGTGKSYTMALLVNALQVRTLIVVPTCELKKQLQADFIKWFGSLKNITIENIDATALETRGNYDLLLLDEAHHAAAKTYQILNKKVWDGIYYKFFFTATAFRSNDEERLLMESVVGQVIYRLTYQEAIKAKYIVPVEAYFIESPKQNEIEGFTWAQVYSELVVNNPARNELLRRLLSSLAEANLSTLCLVKEIKHGENLLALSCHSHFVCGEDAESKKYISAFNSGKIKSLIGTTGVMGEGIDSRAAEYVIIAGLGKSKNVFMQQVGRAVRNYPGKETAKVIIIKDLSHKWTRSHFAAQKKILKDEFSCIPVLLTI